MTPVIQSWSLKWLLYTAGFPLAVFVAAWLGLVYLDRLGEVQLELVALSPYLVLGLVSLLCLRFKQTRVLLTALSFLLFYWGIRTFLQQPLETPLAHYVYTALSFLLPLNLGLAMLTPERGVVRGAGLVFLLVILLQPAVLWLGWRSFPLDLPGLFARFETHPFEGYIISRGATIAFELALAVCLAVGIWLRPRGSMAIILSLGAAFLLLALFHIPHISTVMTGAASLLLLAVPLNHAYNLAYRDELTGLLGRRALNEKMRNLGRHYVIAMLDVDHFKKFNDTYGHDAGDEVLKIVAKHLTRVGGSGIAYRYGGEEFTILFPGSERQDCVPLLEELRRDIAVYDMVLRDRKSRPKSRNRGASKRGKNLAGKRVRVTISIGVAERGDVQDTPEVVLKAADKALYRAKQKGRNCLV